MAMEQRMRPRKRKKVCAFCVDKVTAIDYKADSQVPPMTTAFWRTCKTIRFLREGNRSTQDDRTHYP